MSEQERAKREQAKRPEESKAPPCEPNGGPGRLASSGALDDTVDPHDSGGIFEPIDPNQIAPKP